jgi:hypothetical protein
MSKTKEIQNLYFVCKKYLPKFLPFMRLCGWERGAQGSGGET